MLEGTLKFSDMYGGRTPGRPYGENTEKDVSEASGDFMERADLARPAFFWIALVGMLVGIRLLWQYGGK